MINNHKVFSRSLLLIFMIFTISIPSTIFADGGIDLIIHYVEGTALSDKVGYRVSIDLSALQSNGSSISGLTRDDFKVTEDSYQVEIEDINTSSDLAMNVLVLIDTSGSMQGTPIQDARSAAASFLSNFGVNDQVSAATFNEEMKYLSEFTNDIQTVSSAVGSINAVNLASTCLYDAAYSAAQKMATIESGRRAIILLTDGQDYKSGETCSVHTLDDVIDLASEGSTRVPIYTIGLGDEVDEKSLQRLAEMSGGIYQYAPSSSELRNTFDTLASQLRSQYVVTYLSTAAPGAHTVAVEMKYDNQTVQDTRSFTLPELPLTLTIISPTEGQKIEGTTKLAVSLGGTGEAVDKVVFYLGDSIIASDTTLPYEMDYEFSKDQIGSNVLTAAAVDSQGIDIVSASVSITILETAEVSENPIEAAQSFLDNPLYISLGGGGLAIVLIAVFLILRRKKSAEPVFSDDFNLRENIQPGDDRTIDFSDFSSGQEQGSGNALAVLTVLNSDDVGMIGQQLSITHFPAKVGRGATNDIVISSKDGAVSRDHIIIDQRQGKTVLMESVSTDERGNPKMPTYGTFVNEKNARDQIVQLREGDEIRLGSRFRMRFNHVSTSSGSEDKTIDGFRLDSDEKTRELNQDNDGTRETPRE